MNSITQFVRSGGNRISARLEKERGREWVQRIARSSSVPRSVRRKRHSSSNNDATDSVDRSKYLSVPLMSDHPKLEDDDDIDENSCVICVGSTGAGKSSTISKVTLQNAKSSCGTDRETKKCAKYRVADEVDGEGPLWVDTVGWDDAECEDEDNFKDILRFIDRHEITKVKAIVWNVIPNVRRDALLSKQAHLINLFKDSEIWNNVVIVLKQSMNPDNDGKGAMRAALEYNPYSKIQVVGYRFQEDATISDSQRESLEDPKTREIFNVKTNQEIRDLFKDIIGNIGKPVKVVFNDSKCIDCNQMGDKRLMSAFCHMEKQNVHPGCIEQYHPRKTEEYHPTEVHLAEHDGFLQKPWYSFACLFKTKRYSCCHKKSGKPGCTAKWACCKVAVYGRNLRRKTGCKTRYKCCKTDVGVSSVGCVPKHSCCGLLMNSQGCVKVCKKCNEPWGSPAGECFKKDHNIRDINWVEPPEQLHRTQPQFSSSSSDDEEELDEIRIENASAKNDLPPVILYHII